MYTPYVSVVPCNCKEEKNNQNSKQVRVRLNPFKMYLFKQSFILRQPYYAPCAWVLRAAGMLLNIIYKQENPSIHLCIRACTHLSMHPFIHACICVSMRASIHSSTHDPSIHPSVHSCIHASIHPLSMHPCIHESIHSSNHRA